MIPPADPSASDPRPRHAEKPCIAITMGDPSGIGAEVVVKALADPAIRALGRFIIYGMEEACDVAAGLAEIDPFWFRVPHEDVGEIRSGVVLADYDEFRVPAGVRQPTPECGEASLKFVTDAIEAAKQRRIDAVVTGPINKAGWKMAGCKCPGHTELFAREFNVKRSTMMFVTDTLRVALASTHIALFDLRNLFTIGLVFQPIDLMDEALRACWGIEHPRIAVAGLNPHAGEGGQFGDEEARIIEPAILMAREIGINVEGPFPADTLFCPDRSRRYDGIVAMYHDQGLIPVKLMSFQTAVNMTLGLPVLRVSVDHGTAYDIAGKNRADAGSMKAAIRLACELSSRPAFDLPRVRSTPGEFRRVPKPAAGQIEP